MIFIIETRLVEFLTFESTRLKHPQRVQVAAMTQAAEIAREQALQLLRLQQEVARTS